MTTRLSPPQIYTTPSLTPREAEVLRLLGDGKTTNEIAAELKIAAKTIQDFHHKLKRKLRVENINQLIRIAVLTAVPDQCSAERMRAGRFYSALKRLSEAISEVEATLKEMRAEHDPLASHIFASRRQYREAPDSKSGRRRETVARMSYNEACSLGFRGGFDEWERLMGAVARP